MKNLSIAVALASITLAVAPLSALAAKPCDELKTEIAGKLDAKGVAGYTLDVVANDQVGDQTVVGSCNGGTQKITYKRGSGASTPTPAASDAGAAAQ